MTALMINPALRGPLAARRWRNRATGALYGWVVSSAPTLHARIRQEMRVPADLPDRVRRVRELIQHELDARGQGQRTSSPSGCDLAESDWYELTDALAYG